MSKVIFEGRHYTACVLGDSLIVTSNTRQKGVQVTEAAEWVEAILDDPGDAEYICQFLYRQGN